MRFGAVALAAAALAALLALALSVAAGPALAQEGGGQRASLPDLEDEVMCPVCGVALGLAESSPQAERIRALIRRRIAEGATEQEVKDALVAEFGPDILAVPTDDEFEVIGLALPLVAIGAAAVGLGLGLRRWRREGRQPPGPSGGSAEPPDSAAAQRLEEDLGRYEL